MMVAYTLDMIKKDFENAWYLIITAFVLGFATFLMLTGERKPPEQVKPTERYSYEYTVRYSDYGKDMIPDSLIPKYTSELNKALNSGAIQGMKTCSDLGNYITSTQQNFREIYTRTVMPIQLVKIEMIHSSDGKVTVNNSELIEKYTSAEMVIYDSLRQLFIKSNR